jgi:hypothetical protein
MRDSKPSRRDALKASTALVASVVFPAPLKAAGPTPTVVSQSMIEAARRERMVAFYTAIEIPLAESLGKACSIQIRSASSLELPIQPPLKLSGMRSRHIWKRMTNDVVFYGRCNRVGSGTLIS